MTDIVGVEQSTSTVKQALLDDLASWSNDSAETDNPDASSVHGPVRLAFDTDLGSGDHTHVDAEHYLMALPMQKASVDYSAIDLNPSDGANHAASLASLKTLVNTAL